VAKKIMIIFSKFDDFFSEKESIETHFFFFFFQISAHLGNIPHTRKTMAWVGWVGSIGAVIKDFSNHH
jgi:hypothetical protein